MVTGGALLALLLTRELGRASGRLDDEALHLLGLAIIPVAVVFALVATLRVTEVLAGNG